MQSNNYAPTKDLGNGVTTDFSYTYDIIAEAKGMANKQDQKLAFFEKYIIYEGDNYLCGRCNGAGCGSCED